MAEAKPPSREPWWEDRGQVPDPPDPEPVHPEAWDREPTNESPPELSWYTWHHVEDTETMLLVPRDLHETVRHTGGAAIVRERGPAGAPEAP